MDLIGKKVRHSKYGEGLITDQSDIYVSVKFDSETEIKKFTYPASFGTFLILLDAFTANSIEQIRREQEKHEAQKKAQQQKETDAKYIIQKAQLASASLKNIFIRPFSSVTEFCGSSEAAINDEITYLRTNGGKRYQIFDGERVETIDKRYIYTFETDSELHLPDGTQITLWLSGASSYATVIACEDYNIIFSTNEDLGKTISMIEFSAEPWQLLDALNERLREIKESPSLPIVKTLICDGIKEIDRNGEMIKGQESARLMSTKQPVTFIWGPPGTGKTQTLASIALDHIRRGNRVLMLSYSNVSVDGAIT